MNTKRNEEYKPNELSKDTPENLEFLIADESHIDGVFELMHYRNPEMDKDQLFEKVTKEVKYLSDGKKYGLFVAMVEKSVVGFCRFFLTEEMPKEKNCFPQPDGCFLMGIMVSPKYRRHGIAKLLSKKRELWLCGLGIGEVFSVVALDNPTSIKMHESFGFEEIERGPGFLNVSFDCGEGILFKKTFSLLERLTLFKENNLGLLHNNKVRLVPHNSGWSEVFNKEANLINSKLNIASLKLHHCGSTAIPNIVAKPILDIVGEVVDLEELDKKKELLEVLGYEYKGEYGIKGRRYSVLYNSEKTKGFCHLHIFKSGSKELEDHIIFKDYLISNPQAALRYEELKKSLNIPRSEYSNAKTEIISGLLKEAYKVKDTELS